MSVSASPQHGERSLMRHTDRVEVYRLGSPQCQLLVDPPRCAVKSGLSRFLLLERMSVRMVYGSTSAACSRTRLLLSGAVVGCGLRW